MYLFIDPSLHDQIRIVLYNKGGSKEYTVDGRNRELLNTIVSVFTQEKLSINELDGIAVLLGEGGFSSTRIAAVVGNTLAFALHIPIIGVTREHSLTSESISKLFSTGEIGAFISPTYSGEPNIGTSHL